MDKKAKQERYDFLCQKVDDGEEETDLEQTERIRLGFELDESSQYWRKNDPWTTPQDIWPLPTDVFKKIVVIYRSFEEQYPDIVEEIKKVADEVVISPLNSFQISNVFQFDPSHATVVLVAMAMRYNNTKEYVQLKEISLVEIHQKESNWARDDSIDANAIQRYILPKWKNIVQIIQDLPVSKMEDAVSFKK